MHSAKDLSGLDLIRDLERRSSDEIKELVVFAAAGTPGSGIALTEFRDLFLSGDRAATGDYVTGFAFSDISDWIDKQWRKIEGMLLQMKPYICRRGGLVQALWDGYAKKKNFEEIVAAIASYLPTIPGVPQVLVIVALYVAAYLVKVGLPTWCNW